jgi:hypothetical protein
MPPLTPRRNHPQLRQQSTMATKLSPKEIFFCLFPNGFKNNLLFDDPMYPKEKQFFVLCTNPICKSKHQTSTSSKTAYGNPISHAKTCYDEQELHAFVDRVRKEKGTKTGNNTTLTQQNIFTSFHLKPSGQEHALHHWMRLVTLHNIPITKIKDSDFCSLLSCKKTSCDIFIETMLELSMIVEGKFAVEMKGRKGTIIHGGWSKFSKHYVCLLACYMVDTGKGDYDGVMQMEPQMTLLLAQCYHIQRHLMALKVSVTCFTQ